MVDLNKPHRYYGYGLGAGIVASLTVLYLVGPDIVNYIPKQIGNYTPFKDIINFAANPQNHAVVKVASGALEILAGLVLGHGAGDLARRCAERSNRRERAKEAQGNTVFSPEAIKAMRERSDAKKR